MGSEGGVRTRGGLLPLTQRMGILVQLEWPSEKGRLGYVQLRGGQAVGAESATQSWAGPEGKQAATCNFHTLGPSQGPLRVNFVSELSLWVGEAISLSFRFFFSLGRGGASTVERGRSLAAVHSVAEQ